MELFQINVTFLHKLTFQKMAAYAVTKNSENIQYLMNYPMDFVKICVILMLSLNT